MQSHLVCSGCRNVLLYPGGATNVRCSICNTITPGMEMSHLVCRGCGTLLMYTHGASSVRCSCCHTINLSRTEANQVSQVNCGQCHTTLMYQYGAPSVKCVICHYVTSVGMSNMRLPIPVNRPNGTTHTSLPSTSAPMPHAPQSNTVVVENPMTVDGSGKLVTNVAVGVTRDQK